jgi:putative aldouronate transport system permease protein
MTVPAIVCLVIFCYLPMYGVIIAFKEYVIRQGIWGSPWVGLKQFVSIVTDPFVHRALKNTIILSLLRMVILFPAPIVLALLFNEMRFPTLKRIFQTISDFPFFISWAIVCALTPVWLATDTGWVNHLFVALHIIKEPIPFLARANMFYGITLILELWKGMGYSAIIYLAAIATIDQEQYEAATIDGATRFQKIHYITIPAIMGTVTMLFILQISGILGGNFDVSYLLANSANVSRAQILQTYTYEMGLMKGRFSYATAVGLMLSVVALGFLIGGNWLIKKLSKTEGLF